MEIALYNVTDPPNKLRKSLGSGTILTGALRNDCSVVNPQILIEVQNASVFNYLYIPDYHRYYFITDLECNRTNLWTITAKCDVLMSFADAIANCYATISDATSPSESYINGSQYVPTVRTSTDILQFPGQLPDSGEYVLIVSGGNVT